MTTADVRAFMEPFRMIVMASTDSERFAHASTAPYVRMENDFFILISTVAQHGRNLLKNPDVSLLFAEDESICEQPFARNRVTVNAKACEIARTDGIYADVLERFKERFDPELVATLSQMGDFHLFRLTPSGGSAVSGFGRAYRLNENLEVSTQMVGHHQHGGKNG